MSMFENYTNIPRCYTPNNIIETPIEHPVFKYPLMEYDLKGNLIGFSWHYYDTIILEFLTCGNVYYDEGVAEDAETYLKGKLFSLKIYNFRYELIFEDLIPASNVVKYVLSEKLRKMLIPNTYSMSVTLIDEENDVQQTLLDGNVLKIFVKQ